MNIFFLRPSKKSRRHAGFGDEEASVTPQQAPQEPLSRRLFSPHHNAASSKLQNEMDHEDLTEEGDDGDSAVYPLGSVEELLQRMKRERKRILADQELVERALKSKQALPELMDDDGDLMVRSLIHCRCLSPFSN